MTVISVHVLTERLHALDAEGVIGAFVVRSTRLLNRFFPVADRMPRIRDVFRAR